MITAQFVIDAQQAGARIDQFLAMQVPALSRSRLQALLRDGHATLNGAAARPSAKSARRGRSGTPRATAGGN